MGIDAEAQMLRLVQSIVPSTEIKIGKHLLFLFIEYKGFRFEFEKAQLQLGGLYIRKFRVIHMNTGFRLFDFLQYDNVVDFVFDCHSKRNNSENIFNEFDKLIKDFVYESI